MLKQQVISVQNLVKKYGDVVAVDNVSFEVLTGEIFSILGPNGAGKTTTVEILEGMRKHDGGDIRVLGLNPWKDAAKLHRMIGVIPQASGFFDKTKPKEAVQYYAELFGKKVNGNDILQSVMLDDSAEVIFENLSGGQKQKLSFALCLVNDPELLFLDEPSTGLDPHARRAIWKVILHLKTAGKSILLTTHYLDEAEQLSDRVAIMNRGKIVALGSPRELISKYGTGKKVMIQTDTLEDIFVKLVGGTIEQVEAGELRR